MKHNTAPRTESASAEARLGARLSARLSERSEQLPHDISERLRFARESALNRAREVRSAQTRPIRELSLGLVGMGRSAALSGGPERSPWWLKFASVLPLLALVVGLVLINEGQLYEQILAAADVDTALLADNLPPTAYSDPGFSEYLAGEDE
nr:DUF3619 family protein [uncultured Roseateles sp.]